MKKFLKKIDESDNRTALIKKNIVGSFGLKIIEVALDFILVPLSLAFLTKTDYGIWLIISSMINWLKFFDLGISHGYRNKLAIALSNNNFELAKKYTSTSYIIISLISISISLIGFLIIPRINWCYVLNVSQEYEEVLSSIIFIVLISFSLQLTLKIITTIFLANQMPVLTSLTNTLIKLSTVGLVGSFILFNDGDLYNYSLIISITPIIVLLLTSILFMNTKYKSYRPSFSHYDKSKVNEIIGLGFKFFIIQLGATMLFMTDNIIVAHLFSPEDVTPYQITLKYFGIVFTVFSVLIAPYWSAITDAYNKDDFGWIKKSISSLVKIWKYGIIFSLILFVGFYPILKIWVGNEIYVPWSLTIQCLIFVIMLTYNNIYTFFLNGTGKIHLQMLTGIFSLLVNIPLSIFFAKHLQLGVSGVLMATNCSLLIYIITRKIQYHKIIGKTATGIWIK